MTNEDNFDNLGVIRPSFAHDTPHTIDEIIKHALHEFSPGTKVTRGNMTFRIDLTFVETCCNIYIYSMEKGLTDDAC